MKNKEQIEKTLREVKENGSTEWKSEEKHAGFVEALEWVLAKKKVDNWPFENMKKKNFWPWFQE